MTPAGDYELGPLQAGDAPALARVHCEVWRATYADLMHAEDFARLTPERFEPHWQRRVEEFSSTGELPASECLIVARHQGVPVGFVSAGPPRTSGPADWELWALNVVPAHHGTGLAQRMLAEALGDRPALLWVANGNDRAIRFYTRQGFTPDGEQAERDDGLLELRMVRG